jgi:hypothetical protein
MFLWCIEGLRWNGVLNPARKSVLKMRGDGPGSLTNTVKLALILRIRRCSLRFNRFDTAAYAVENRCTCLSCVKCCIEQLLVIDINYYRVFRSAPHQKPSSWVFSFLTTNAPERHCNIPASHQVYLADREVLPC